MKAASEGNERKYLYVWCTLSPYSLINSHERRVTWCISGRDSHKPKKGLQQINPQCPPINHRHQTRAQSGDYTRRGGCDIGHLGGGDHETLYKRPKRYITLVLSSQHDRVNYSWHLYSLSEAMRETYGLRVLGAMLAQLAWEVAAHM